MFDVVNDIENCPVSVMVTINSKLLLFDFQN